MNGIEVYISDTLVPIKPGTKIRITKQVNEIGDLETRQSDFAYEVDIELIASVRVLFGMTNLTNSNDDAAYTRQEGRIYEFGIPIMLVADVYLREVDGDYAKAVFISGYAAFAARIKGKTLHDIGYAAADNHQWNAGDIQTVMANTNGPVYAIGQWGGFDTGFRVDVEYLHTSYYFYTLYQLICSDVGYTVDDLSYLPTATKDFLRKLVFPFSRANGWKHCSRFLEDTGLNKSISGMQQPLGEATTASHTNTVAHIVFFPGADRYTAGAALTLTNVTININIANFTEVEPPTNSITPKVAILKNGGTVVASTTLTGNGQFTVTSASVPLVTNDYLEAVFLFDATMADADNPPYFEFDLLTCTFFADDLSKDIQIDDTVFPEDVVPDMPQSEFLKGLFNMFGIIPQVDNLNKVVYFRQFKEITDTISDGTGLDWTSKLIKPDGAREWYLEKSTDIGYGQVNRMHYLPDETLEVPETGNFEFTINDTALPPNNEVFTLPWAASATVSFSGVPVAKIEYYVSDGAGGYEKGESPRQRIGYVDRNNVSITFYEGGVSQYTENTNVPFLKFIDNNELYNLGLNNNLFPLHYSSWYNSINRALKLRVLLNLTPNDIHNLDHFKAVYFQQFGQWFYINRVDYLPGEIAEVEIIRIKQ